MGCKISYVILSEITFVLDRMIIYDINEDWLQRNKLIESHFICISMYIYLPKAFTESLTNLAIADYKKKNYNSSEVEILHGGLPYV